MIGFDYGTSNCAVGVMSDDRPQLVELNGHGRYMLSSLYAPAREVIVNWLHQQLPSEAQQEFKFSRQPQLMKGQGVLRELALDGIPSELSFGRLALENYLEEPDEGYYIKSPKSFLGASGLVPSQIALFEDIVAAMMAQVKRLTEEKLQRQVTSTVIGKPINFQGINGQKSNEQALTILTNAAKRVGFKQVEFLYEPVAAGFEFEASLTRETKVLVVDIGGGTTDCSMMLMSPKFIECSDRQQHMLGHSGKRIGGNDFDIRLALKGIMPSLGMDGLLKTGKPMPANCYSDASAVNNIVAQTDFYSQANGRFLTQLVREAQVPELAARLLKVHHDKLTYQLVNCAEQAKIALSDHNEHQINLDFLDRGLVIDVVRDTLKNANQHILLGVAKLMHEAVAQAQCQPDVVFVTGGTAQSPVLRAVIESQFPNCELVVGDHFGSVTAGLTRWAQRIYS
jgi:hypothetical chaperone protein